MKRIWSRVRILVGTLVGLFLAFLLVLTITEFKPDQVMKVELAGTPGIETIREGDGLRILTWNAGYGSLGETADFFMDGGTHVRTASTDMVYANLDHINRVILDMEPDFILMQELDTDSTRSHHIDEPGYMAQALDGYQYSMGINYKTLYVPYPVPPIGKVESGIVTFSAYEVADSERISLPCPFSYPIRLANLKRCFLVDRIDLAGTDQQLVVVNLHLEAYDSGDGKLAQTKMLKEFLEGEAAKGNYVVAGGDFNQSFSNVDTSMYPSVSEELWTPGTIDVTAFEGLTFASDNSSPSCRLLDRPYKGADKSSFQYYVIDGFIVSDNITINKIQTMDLGFYASDHNPIVMDITLE